MAIYERQGKSYGTLYHVGKEKLSKIEPSKLQSRDTGFYGQGFYASTVPNKGYGNKITKLKLSENAKVLHSELKPHEALPELANDVLQHHLNTGLKRAIERNKEQSFRFEHGQIMNNHLAWKNAVDRFAEAHGYDAVRHSDAEIVIKNLKKVDVIKDSTA